MAKLDFRIIGQECGKSLLGESPFWDPQNNDLWWVDVDGGRLLTADTVSGRTRAWETPEPPGFVVLVAPGRPAVGMRTGIFAFSPEAGAFDRLVAFEQAGCRFNDAAVDANGRLWASTMAMDARAGHGAVHVITRDLKLETVADGLTIPNGLAVDLERERLFYSDSHPDIQTIWVRPLTSGREQEGDTSVFVTTGNLDGRPDGAALDQRGFYWIAGVDGAELYVFDLKGALHATVATPFPRPTKVSFSSPDGRTIAITSKTGGENGGYVALAATPAGLPAGLAQPYWKPGVSRPRSTREGI